MAQPNHWSLGAKLALVATPFLLLALFSITLTLWVSWQLEGGAAAVNEAGRMRLQANRMALSVAAPEHVETDWHSRCWRRNTACTPAIAVAAAVRPRPGCA